MGLCKPIRIRRVPRVNSLQPAFLGSSPSFLHFRKKSKNLSRLILEMDVVALAENADNLAYHA